MCVIELIGKAHLKLIPRPIRGEWIAYTPTSGNYPIHRLSSVSATMCCEEIQVSPKIRVVYSPPELLPNSRFRKISPQHVDCCQRCQQSTNASLSHSDRRPLCTARWSRRSKRRASRQLTVANGPVFAPTGTCKKGRFLLIKHQLQ